MKISVFLLLLSVSISLFARPLVVVIDPGHGGTNTGVIYKDIVEKQLTLILARKVVSFIRQHSSIIVYLTRTEDRTVTMKERIATIDRYHPDLFISLHFNAQILIQSNRGFEIYYPKDKTDLPPQEFFVNYDRINRSFFYGTIFKKHYLKSKLYTTWKLPLNLFKAHWNLKLLNDAHYPGLLLEVAYVTNPEDRSCIENPAFTRDIAVYILSALKEIQKKMAETQKR